LANQEHRSTAPVRKMRRRRRQGNPTLEKNNSIDDLVGNEENEHSVSDPKRTMINMTMSLVMFTKKVSQRGNHG
jgi:hypothetical protein